MAALRSRDRQRSTSGARGRRPSQAARPPPGQDLSQQATEGCPMTAARLAGEFVEYGTKRDKHGAGYREGEEAAGVRRVDGFTRRKRVLVADKLCHLPQILS